MRSRPPVVAALVRQRSRNVADGHPGASSIAVERMLTGLAPTEALSIQRYSSIEDFETGPRLVDGSSIPLDLPHFAAQRAILNLPTCRVELQATFPRMLDATYDGHGLLVMMSFHGLSV